MNFWTAAIIIVAIWGFVQVYRTRHGIIEDRHGNQSAMPRADDPALEREITELRERLKVLERIATDANSAESRETKAIADEIERLRDR